MKDLVNKNIQKSEASTISIQKTLNSITKEHVFRSLAIVFFGLITIVAIQTNSPFMYEILVGEAILLLALFVGYISNRQTIKK